MTLRQELEALLRGYRTTTVEPMATEPAVEQRHAEPTRRPPRAAKKRATISAKHLAPETKDPSPE